MDRCGLDYLKFIKHINRIEFIKGDVRKTKNIQEAIDGIDAVIHLAAIVGDPACAKQPDVAMETNWVASKKLFDLCNNSKNVKRFIFASTCSNYGKMEGDGFVNEESSLSPVSLYAKLKVKVEKYILQSKTRNDFIPTSLRFSTVYGLSPRIRFDLTVNEFVRELAFERELVIFGEQFWRPYCHVEDLAKACITILESDAEKVSHNVYGVGDTSENYQKQMLAHELIQIFPHGKIKYVHKDEDPRDYKVDFSKIKKELNFNITKTVPDGMIEIANILKDGLLVNPFDRKYKNI